jgi:hypothetical protein
MGDCGRAIAFSNKMLDLEKIMGDFVHFFFQRKHQAHRVGGFLFLVNDDTLAKIQPSLR